MTLFPFHGSSQQDQYIQPTVGPKYVFVYLVWTQIEDRTLIEFLWDQ